MKKNISEAKLQANRANALKSTGPRTPEGKARSSRNAWKHGFTAAFSDDLHYPARLGRVRPPEAGIGARDLTALGEHPAHFPATVRALLTTWSPTSPHEVSLLKRLAELEVRLDRFTRVETGLLDLEMTEIKPTHSPERINAAAASSFSNQKEAFNVLARYEANISRAYDRTLKQLLTLRKAGLPPTLPPTPDFCETNPTPIENAEVSSDLEAAEPIEPTFRTDDNPPPDPADAASRRHGRTEPLPERKLPPVELVWIGPDGKELDFSRRDREELAELRRRNSPDSDAQW